MVRKLSINYKLITTDYDHDPWAAYLRQFCFWKTDSNVQVLLYICHKQNLGLTNSFLVIFSTHNAYLTDSAYLRYAYLSEKLKTKKLVNPFWKMSRHAPAQKYNSINYKQ